MGASRGMCRHRHSGAEDVQAAGAGCSAPRVTCAYRVRAGTGRGEVAALGLTHDRLAARSNFAMRCGV
jgi:hypothetical protein